MDLEASRTGTVLCQNHMKGPEGVDCEKMIEDEDIVSRVGRWWIDK